MVITMSDIPAFDRNAVGAAYVYMAVADHIAARIEAGQLPAGAKLPGERELAEVYGVALGTARRAVEELRNRKLVVTLPAKGTYVNGGEK
jgi:DNA-binding GntR family transcriptional regulator